MDGWMDGRTEFQLFWKVDSKMGAGVRLALGG